jgi:hypothetical protein
VVHRGPEDITGVCRCNPWRCDDLALGPQSLVVWELSWTRLARALCRVFELDAQESRLGLPQTRQIGTWSAEALPVVLTIQARSEWFRRVLAELCVRLQKPFILLAPTRRHLDIPSEELLTRVGARCFGLDTSVRVAEGARLWAPVAPGKLFGAFLSEPEGEPDEAAARGALEIVKALDTRRGFPAPSLFTVFRLYCVEGLSASAVAAKCGVSKTSVMRRLSTIRAATGASPEQLRRLSPHVGKLEENLSDPRARRLRRLDFIDDSAEDNQ